MARSISEIEAELLAVKAGQAELNGLNSTSKVAVWRLLFYVVAVAIYTLELLFDRHKADVDKALLLLKPHTGRWYREKALAFQYGYPLVADTDYYNNSGVDESLVEASKIISYVAVSEATADSRVILKIATETAGELSPISPAQKQAFEAYMAEVKDVGVRLSVINFLPDQLFLTMRIFYDPLVLDSNGNHIANGNKPVNQAITNYLKNLPFDGELVLAHLIDALQAVPGVRIPQIDYAATAWIDETTGMYGSPIPINVKTIPLSGYFKVVDFNSITYVV